MKSFFTSFFVLFFSISNIYAQDLVEILETPSMEYDTYNQSYVSNGVVYVPSYKGILYVKTDTLWEKYTIDEGNELYGVTVDADGLIWMCSKNGLFSFDLTTVTQYTTANSDLPYNDIRLIKEHNGKLWMAAWNHGLIVKDGESYTSFTKSNSLLKSDFIDDIDFLNDDRTVVARSWNLFFIDTNFAWEVLDAGTLFGSSVQISDIEIDENGDVLLATNIGLKKYDVVNKTGVDLASTTGVLNLSSLINVPNDGIWAFEEWEGVHFFSTNGENYFYKYLDFGFGGFSASFSYYDGQVWLSSSSKYICGLTISGVTNTKFIGFTPKVSIYPNPVKKVFNVKADHLISVAVFDIKGSFIKKINGSEIDLENENKGFYFLKIQTKEGVATGKILLD